MHHLDTNRRKAKKKRTFQQLIFMNKNTQMGQIKKKTLQMQITVSELVKYYDIKYANIQDSELTFVPGLNFSREIKIRVCDSENERLI